METAAAVRFGGALITRSDHFSPQAARLDVLTRNVELCILVVAAEETTKELVATSHELVEEARDRMARLAEERLCLNALAGVE
jgi:hypothetical protein